MADRISLPQCVQAVREYAAGRDASDCLYRGEAKLYDTTPSSHYRLFHLLKRFSDGQARAVQERLVAIARLLEIVGLGSPVYSSAENALNHIEPTTLDDINEVIYCYMQHYHLPTPFIDLTTDIDVAAFFAADDGASEDENVDLSEPRPGVIYVVSKNGLREAGVRTFPSIDSAASRPRVQKAVSLFLTKDTNFQAIPAVLKRFEYEDTVETRLRYCKPELYDATQDWIAGEVAGLTYRCAYMDLASDDPSHGRVSEFFAQICERLCKAGAIPRV